MTPARGQQIIPDNTLGAEISVVTPNVVINGTPSDRISGGATRGETLFHSFQQFNIDAGKGAYFAPANNIANILTRVTGTSSSNILGVLGVLGNANLFFINPNGIIFGENARLALNGSFLASTASSFKFPDGNEFSATNPQAPPLLAVSIPNGLQFRNNPTSIRVDSGVFNNAQNPGLNVSPGKSLALVGGEVLLNGGVLRAPNGRVELGGLATAGEVKLEANGNNLRLTFPEGVERSNVSLSNVSSVNVNNRGEGSIGINAKNLAVSGSLIESGIQTGIVNNTRTGNVEIDAKESVNVSSGSVIRNNNGGTGNTGDVIIKTDKLSVSGSQILATILATGNGSAGKVEILAKEVSLTGTQQLTGIFNNIAGNNNSRGRGSVGGITIDTNSLAIANGAQISSVTAGIGNAGNVTIIARERFTLDNSATPFNRSGVFSNVERTGNGNAGNISVTTNNLDIKNGAQIASGIFSNQNAGNSGGTITINATDNISIDGEGSTQLEGVLKSAVVSAVQNNAQGSGGDVNITARSLSLTNGGSLSVTNRGQGSAGNITVTTSEDIKLDKEASIRALTAGEGGEGNITLNSRNLILNRNSYITTDARSSATGGSITINTGNLVGLRNSDITANARQGSAGKIDITTRGSVFGIARLSQQQIDQLRQDAEKAPLDINSPPVTNKLPTSDIAAFSQAPTLDGAIQINNPEVDPSEELAEFPETVVDPTQQIAQNPCQQSVASRFVVTGRGGLPPSPNQVLGSENVRVDLLEPVASTGNSNSATKIQSSPSPSSTAKQIIPAQGWVFNERGKIVLVAHNPDQIVSQRSPKALSSCSVETAQ
ncbi:hypothetical protein WA1_07015 [Scytonema hofmannii PCC 7110]|uniref:Filamentous haemagglutinin FhaB/tRNA nuclease CdiA-like TPS domain-containing protein n=1 Tax=Scytonema hofmannii PCC 7110 TaxID=128403 RepID=A0A139WT33_9CYAN|nr:filamentous hemagglutinin N-terminal domain-containing protein [Scytonema hofmannii]KYC35567.1 hypothetical protein WA1_07015 [Scytonema hofmannii PCC 7110]